jgi:two-component system response regulator CpxR
MAHILVIDDVDYIRKSIKRVLESNGFQCDTCENGQQGITKVSEKSYDLIITDIMMPEADGYEFLDYLRALPDPNNKTPVLAISGGDKTINSDIALSIINEKADAILPKPFAKDDLLGAVANLLGQERYTQIVKGAAG